MTDKPDLESAFAVVADWFENYFGYLGPQVGKKFGETLRTFSEMANASSKYWGEEWRSKIDELDATSDRLLMEFFLHYLNAKNYRVGNSPDGRMSIEPSEN